ncbi:LrgB family protein [Rhodobacter sp. HX-7-19]|uniref:LrgB family protein n=1 Tax=Paragemmobacter kunshanensis TaxID=2583234 RepID=A0A6M1TS16_9RHOB|nr:LrgB family protein [Rhodobacter kunshanensis]NGQ90617.1 LrgB family protein [Rhodobacter kunshanensis]
MRQDFALWVYLTQGPLLWLTVTLAAYAVADWLSQRAGRHPVANPVLISVLLVGGLLVASGTEYATYFDGAQFIHFLLGPATVALALPLWEHRALVMRSAVPMLAALVAGSVVAAASAVAVVWAFGAPEGVLVAIAPKSVTAGVAMSITEAQGGDPALTAVLVILTGMIGALVVTPLMNGLGIRDYRARGFAVGLASHGIGTARAFQVDPVAGTFAGIAIGLNAVMTALIVPVLLGVLR